MGLEKATSKVTSTTLSHITFQPSKLSIFTDLERKELKDIINEVLDERTTTSA